MGLEPALKNMNILCSSEVLWQTVPEARAIVIKGRLAMGGVLTFGITRRLLPEERRGRKGSYGISNSDR